MAASGDNSRDSRGAVSGVKIGDSKRLRAIDQAVAWNVDPGMGCDVSKTNREVGDWSLECQSLLWGRIEQRATCSFPEI